MASDLLQKSFAILTRRQTNILSAAVVIMATVVFSQILGLIRQRLLAAFFGASEPLGVYFVAQKLPEWLFGVIFAAAFSSAFIPVFSDFLAKEKEKEAHAMASTVLVIGLLVFLLLSIPLFIFAPFFLQLINLGAGFSTQQELMTNLLRIILVGQMLFVVGIFFSAVLQSYNHFFIPGIAAAFVNVGTIFGILIFAPYIGIYAPAYGTILGALLFILAQVLMIKKIGFAFSPRISLKTPGVLEVLRLMWPRTFSLSVFQLGEFAAVNLVSFLPMSGRNYVILDYAKTLAFASVALFGQTIAQAAFPVLSREREKIEQFKVTFTTSFNQMLYLVLPISALFLVLRIPIVRLVFGAGQFDWDATVLTGRTLAFFSLSIFAQALVNLVARGFYALHDTKTPLLIGAFSTLCMIVAGFVFVVRYGFGVESIAVAYSIKNILDLVLSMIFLGRKLGGFHTELFNSTFKIFLATFFSGFALYIPIKLLDQLVFDTTRTINLLLLTGISSVIGLSLYVFLTWLFNVKEAQTFLLLFKKIGNWREILEKSDEAIDAAQFKA